MKIVLMELKKFFAGKTATAIVGFLMLFGLVFLLYLRNGFVAAIGFAIAIILGRKAVNRIVSKGTDRQDRTGKNTSKIKNGT